MTPTPVLARFAITRMSLSPRILLRVWLIAPVCACAFLAWSNHERIRRVEYVSGLAGRAGSADAVAPSSPTGYANGQRQLIVPERNETSFEWIAQTQQMLAQGEMRVRQVAYDNAPLGREVRATSPYRWWLGAVAWADHLLSGRPVGLAVERASLYAEPLAHGLLLVFASGLVAWRFGGFAAALFSIGLVTIFPFAAGFLPGVPDQHGLARACGLAGVLLLLAGLRDNRRTARWFALAGVVGGVGLWLDVPTQVPLLAGVGLGGLIAAGIMRRNPAGIPALVLSGRCWRHWGLGGAVTVCAVYLVEYFPSFLGGWHLDFPHPLYGLAWLGLGELLVLTTGWGRRENPPWSTGRLVRLALAVAAVVAVPVAMSWSGSRGYLARDLLSVRLTNLPGGLVAASSWGWLSRSGLTGLAWATLLPLVTLLPAGWMVMSGRLGLRLRISLAVALGPVLIALGFATQQLAWWSVLDGMLLGVMVAATAERPPAESKPNPWLWTALLALYALPGLGQLWPERSIDANLVLTPAETEELVERDLAHWLASHAGESGAVVFAPPHQTLALGFYGGLRGVGTFSADNHAGFGTALMISGANSMQDVQALVQAREIKYLVIPSWDPFFEEFGRLYLAAQFSNRKSYFVGELRRWNLPLWLRPVAYPMPVIPGFEKQSVLLFEVVDEQKPAVALSRLAEYFVETGDLDRAASVGEALRRFPGDVGAMAARVQVLNARSDSGGTTQTLDALLSRLSAGADRFLPWDRRVSLAIALARGERIEPAREQTRRCLAEIDEQKIRSLSTDALYGLLVLGQSFGLPMADARLHDLALALLPPDVRSGL